MILIQEEFALSEKKSATATVTDFTKY